MRLGFGLPIAGSWATPDNLVTVARRAEDLGYHSLWVFQRLFYAVAPKNQYYGATGTTWPESFRSVLDPLVALSFVAAETRQVRLGISVLLTPLYTPLVLAKMLASLDVVSRGRLDVGLGTAWSLDELEAVGAKPEERGERAEELIQVVKTAWTQDEIEFRGRFFTIPRARVEPKPVQRPHPPILIGGYSERVVRRIARVADGYAGGNVPLDQITTVVDRVRRAWGEAGRDAAALRIVCRGSFVLTPEPQPAGRRALHGSADQIREDLARYAAAGVTEVFLEPNFAPGGAALDRALHALETFRPDGAR